MDYRNLESVGATIGSYLEAFQKLVAICPKLESSANESNQRVVLPTSWRPAFGTSREKLLPYANSLIAVEFHRLVEYGEAPQFITERHRLWKEDFFSVRWAIRVPFSIHVWEIGHSAYTDEKEVLHEAVPDTMKPWCSPQHLTIADGSYTGKSWGLKDWYAKHDEIEHYLDETQVEEKQREHYTKEVAGADKEVARWQEAIGSASHMAELLRAREEEP